MDVGKTRKFFAVNIPIPGYVWGCVGHKGEADHVLFTTVTMDTKRAMNFLA